jgi:hypothetical protein
MPTAREPEDDAAILKEILAEAPPMPDEAAIQAMLLDPVSGGIIARVVEKRAGLLTPKGIEHAKRTLAIFFLINPEAAATMAQARAGDRSGTVATGGEAPAQDAAGGKGRA